MGIANFHFKTNLLSSALRNLTLQTISFTFITPSVLGGGNGYIFTAKYQKFFCIFKIQGNFTHDLAKKLYSSLVNVKVFVFKCGWQGFESLLGIK